MSNFITVDVNDKSVNKYLFYKNLYINRKFSASKKIIKKINHYLWWFQKQQLRKSFFIFKGNIPIFISTCDYASFKKYKIIYSGLISCTPETNLFDLLKSIKIQNDYLNKKKNHYCIISIDKNNKVLMKHWKYFGYKPLLSSLDFFEFCKKEFNIKLNYNLYYKKI